MRRRRSVLVGVSAAIGLAGCAGTPLEDRLTGRGSAEIDHPEPDTLAGQPVVNRGDTYAIEQTAYTVAKTLDRGEQPIELETGTTLLAYVTDRGFYERGVRYQLTEPEIGTEIAQEHHRPVDGGIELDGGTLRLETVTESVGTIHVGREIEEIAGLYLSLLGLDAIPFRLDLTVTSGDDTTYEGRVTSETAVAYLDRDVFGIDVVADLKERMIE
jgi:hypothetical protein